MAQDNVIPFPNARQPETRDDWYDWDAPMWEDVPQLREPITIRIQADELPKTSPSVGAVIVQIVAGLIAGFVLATLVSGGI